MQAQIHADSNIEGDEQLAQKVEAVVKGALAHFSAYFTRVEVHLSDQKSGTVDRCCLLVARPAGHQPISVSDQASTVDQAVDGAAQKMKNSFETLLKL